MDVDYGEENDYPACTPNSIRTRNNCYRSGKGKLEPDLPRSTINNTLLRKQGNLLLFKMPVPGSVQCPGDFPRELNRYAAVSKKPHLPLTLPNPLRYLVATLNMQLRS